MLPRCAEAVVTRSSTVIVADPRDMANALEPEGVKHKLRTMERFAEK
jgi:hypothetical protein